MIADIQRLLREVRRWRPSAPGIGVDAPRERQVLHRHADARLVLFLQGGVREEVFDREAQFAPGEFVVRPPYFAHMDHAGPSGSTYVRLSVSTDRLRRWIETRGWCAVRGRVDLVQLDWSDVIHHPSGGDLLLDLAAADGHEAKPAARGLHGAARWLEDPGGPKLDAIADRLEMAPYQFTRRFAAVHGVSPREYSRQARLQRAMQQLAERSGPIASIAVGAGFYDQSHLSRELRRETGLTPGQFQRVAAGA